MDLLVSADWLANNIEREDVKILDGTWVLPEDESKLSKGFIPGAKIFDIDDIADLSSPMKHMLPTAESFSNAMSKLGIYNADHIICYDRHGLFSSPRVWWTFMTFGHEKVSILNGGLPAWVNAGLNVVSSPSSGGDISNFNLNAPLIHVTDKVCVLGALNEDVQIVDARPSGRFHGTSPEPRVGLRSGRIPGSLSLPFGELKTKDNFLRPQSELEKLVRDAGIDLTKPIITSCGSGITAAGLAFVFHQLGAKDISLYDGSWAEWGASDAPLEI